MRCSHMAPVHRLPMPWHRLIPIGASKRLHSAVYFSLECIMIILTERSLWCLGRGGHVWSGREGRGVVATWRRHVGVTCRAVVMEIRAGLGHVGSRDEEPVVIPVTARGMVGVVRVTGRGQPVTKLMLQAIL